MTRRAHHARNARIRALPFLFLLALVNSALASPLPLSESGALNALSHAESAGSPVPGPDTELAVEVEPPVGSALSKRGLFGFGSNVAPHQLHKPASHGPGAVLAGEYGPDPIDDDDDAAHSGGGGGFLGAQGSFGYSGEWTADTGLAAAAAGSSRPDSRPVSLKPVGGAAAGAGAGSSPSSDSASSAYPLCPPSLLSALGSTPSRPLPHGYAHFPRFRWAGDDLSGPVPVAPAAACLSACAKYGASCGGVWFDGERGRCSLKGTREGDWAFEWTGEEEDGVTLRGGCAAWAGRVGSEMDAACCRL